MYVNKQHLRQNRFLLIFLALLLSSNAFAQVAETIPSDFIFQTESSGQMYDKYHFYAPNENAPGRFQDVLEHRQGSLICVGTFRCFMDAALGNFENVILWDFDPEIVSFNRLHLEFIHELGKSGLSSSEQRHIYLQTITNLAIQDPSVLNHPSLRELSSWAKKIPNLQSDFSLVDDYLLDVQNVSLFYQYPLAYGFLKANADPKSLNLGADFFPRDLKDLAHEIIARLSQSMVSYNPFRSERDNNWAVYKQFFLMHTNGLLSENQDAYYWLSDKQWEKIRDLVSRRKIHLYNGNLLHKDSFESLAKYCRENKMVISTIDVSNVDIVGERFEVATCDQNSKNCFWDGKSEFGVRLKNLTEGGSGFFAGLEILPTVDEILVLSTYLKYKKHLGKRMGRLLRQEAKTLCVENLKRCTSRSKDAWVYFAFHFPKSSIASMDNHQVFVEQLRAAERAFCSLQCNSISGVPDLVSVRY